MNISGIVCKVFARNSTALLTRGSNFERTFKISFNSNEFVLPCGAKTDLGSSLRFFSTTNANPNNRAVSKHVRQDTFTEKAKEATKTTYYGAVVLIGLGVTAYAAYILFRELLAPFSPQAVYSDAVKLCTADSRVQDRLGDSIKCYGEESRRRRRQHVSHMTYEVEGQKGMRLMFHLKGSYGTATAHLDARDGVGGWKYRYLYVQLDQYPDQVIVIQDNRGDAATVLDQPLSSSSLTTPLAPLYPPQK